MLSVKQGSCEYQFSSHWCDPTRNEIRVYSSRDRRSIALGHLSWNIPRHYETNPKFRMVFDCAASVGGVSPNNQILQGSDNTNSLLGVLFRFRFHEVALVGDIRNMFHQVKVPPADQSVLRFYWWRNGDLDFPISTYQLTVHCFGLTSSPSVSGFS